MFFSTPIGGARGEGKWVGPPGLARLRRSSRDRCARSRDRSLPAGGECASPRGIRMRASAPQRLLRAPRRPRRGLSAIGPCARAPGGLWAEVGDPPGLAPQAELRPLRCARIRSPTENRVRRRVELSASAAARVPSRETGRNRVGRSATFVPARAPATPPPVRCGSRSAERGFSVAGWRESDGVWLCSVRGMQRGNAAGGCDSTQDPKGVEILLRSLHERGAGG